MFNKFLISVIFCIVIINIIFIYLTFIKGDKIINVKKENSSPSTSPLPDTNDQENPFSQLQYISYPAPRGVNLTSNVCTLYTHEEHINVLDNISKRLKPLTTNNVFPYVINKKAFSYYKGDCYDDDQLFAVYATHQCLPGRTRSEIKNRCYSQTGRVISNGDTENLTINCNSNKCDGNIGHLSFNFSVTNDKNYKDLLVVDQTSRFFSLTGVCLPEKKLNSLNPIFNNTDKDFAEYYYFVRQNITPSKMEDEYPITYQMNGDMVNDFKSKLKITRYNYGVSGLNSQFGVCSSGLYGSIIFRPLNMYLTIGTSYIDEEKKSKRTIYNIKDPETGKSTANLVLKDFKEENYEESIVWMFMPNIDFFANLIPTTTRCSYYKHSPETCIDNDNSGSQQLGSYEKANNSYFSPNDFSHQIPIIKNDNCDNSFLRKQVDIGATVVQSKYVTNTWLSQTDSYMTDDQTNLLDDSNNKKHKTLNADATNREYDTRYIDNHIPSFPYYAPLYNEEVNQDSDSTGDDDNPNPELLGEGDGIDTAKFQPYIASDGHLFCIENSNGDVKTKYQYITYPKIAYEALTGGFLSNTDFREPPNDGLLLVDDLMLNIYHDSTYSKALDRDGGSPIPILASNRREVVLIDTKNNATDFGGSVFTDGDVVWKPVNPYNNVITFPKEYFLGSGGGVSRPHGVSISTFGSGYQGYDKSQYNSINSFSFDTVLDNFNLNWYNQVASYTYENTSNPFNKGDAFCIFEVLIQDNSVQNIVLQDPGKGFNTDDGLSTFIISPPSDKILNLPEISINVLQTIDRTYSYRVTNKSTSQVGYGLLVTGVCISQSGGLSIESGKTASNQLNVVFSGEGYKEDDIYHISEYDFNGIKISNNNEGTIKIKELIKETDIFALDPINKTLYQNDGSDVNLNSYSLKMVTEENKENYSTPSPPQLCFVGDFIEEGTSSHLNPVTKGGDYDDFNTTIGLLKQIIPESNSNNFITFFNLMKNDQFRTETSVDFFKTLQFEELNYTKGSKLKISTKEKLVIGKFIPYSTMTMFSTDLEFGKTFEGIFGGQVIPGQYIGDDYDVRISLYNHIYANKDKALTKFADNGKINFYNYNHTQFIPYGLKNLNELTSF